MSLVYQALIPSFVSSANFLRVHFALSSSSSMKI